MTIQGREALERAFAEFFKKSPKVHAELAPKSLQFVSRDNAIEEGIVTVRSESSLAGRDARYKALFVREDGRWKLAVLDESPSDEVSMRNLDWLVGEWTSKGQDQAADITTTYSWNAGKKFLEVRFTIKEKNLPLSGMQVIGIDPATGQIHSWTFEAGGGIGEADWSRDGDHWVLNAEGTLADGRTLTETNILRRVNQDTFTWQSINRMLDGAELADLPPVKVTRVKSK